MGRRWNQTSPTIAGQRPRRDITKSGVKAVEGERFTKTSRGAMLRGNGCHIGFFQRRDHDDLRPIRAGIYRFQQGQSMRSGIDIDNNQGEPLHLVLQDLKRIRAGPCYQHIAAPVRRG